MFEYAQREYKKVAVNGEKVAQRTVMIDFHTGAGVYVGSSGDGEEPSRMIKDDWTNTKQTFEDTVKEQNENIDPVTGKRVARPIYQCAEPNALVNALNDVSNRIYNIQTKQELDNGIKKDWIEEAKFENIRGDNTTPTPSVPCAVCKQWVKGDWGAILRILRESIKKDTEIKRAAKLRIVDPPAKIYASKEQMKALLSSWTNKDKKLPPK